MANAAHTSRAPRARRRAIAVAIVVVLAAAAGAVLYFATSSTKQPEPEPQKDFPIVVSLGDSYSSGEGIPPFYGQEETDFQTKANDDDWLAHRSQASWPGKLVVSSATERALLGTFKDTKWIFRASSGALAKHLEEPQVKQYANRKLGSENVSGTRSLAPQLDAFDEIEPNSADYVTITIGGNDLGFDGIVRQAAKRLNLLGAESLVNDLQSKLDAFDDISNPDCPSMRLARAYRAVADAAGPQAQIIVAGYPTLFDESSSNAFISAEEAKAVNDAARELDAMMAQLCTTLTKQNNIYGITVENLHYVSVIDEFAGHEAEYLNGITLGAQEQDIDQTALVSSYSVHPNEAGTNAYARAVQATLDELEALR